MNPTYVRNMINDYENKFKLDDTTALMGGNPETQTQILVPDNTNAQRPRIQNINPNNFPNANNLVQNMGGNNFGSVIQEFINNPSFHHSTIGVGRDVNKMRDVGWSPKLDSSDMYLINQKSIAENIEVVKRRFGTRRPNYIDV